MLPTTNTPQPWRYSDRADPRALPLADRHYNRQKVGSPQFVPPGRCLVLLSDDAQALLIVAACAATAAHWPNLPPAGIVTFVDATQTRRKRDPGRCYRKAGWTHVGFTKAGLWAFQLRPEDFPPPLPARPRHTNQIALFDFVAAGGVA